MFTWVAEYPILIVLAVLCRPGPRTAANALAVRYALFGAIAVGVLALVWSRRTPRQ